MKRNVEQYDYQELNEVREVLEALGLPKGLINPRCVMAFAAIAEIKHGKWNKISENYKGTHGIIEYISKNYHNKAGLDKSDYSENSRETFRKYTIYPWITAGILEGKPGLATNAKDNAYRFTSHAAALFRHYGTPEWDEALRTYTELHPKYAEIQKQVKNIDIGYQINYGNLSFSLGRSPHNKLQKQILELFARRFAPGADLLYIGDTKDKGLHKDTVSMKALGIDVFDQTAKIPDIILYDKTNRRVLFIEAYNSTGEFTFDRVSQIKQALHVDKHTEIAFITAFATTKKMLSVFKRIAWDTDIWVVEDETHLTHKNGDRFIGRKLSD